LQENNNISGYSNPELDMISKDIAELVRERQNMEQDIAQKEADIKIKNGEIKSLQSELDTLAATLKQLGNQKGEAQKRLNDLKAQVNNSLVRYSLMACLVNVLFRRNCCSAHAVAVYTGCPVITVSFLMCR